MKCSNAFLVTFTAAAMLLTIGIHDYINWGAFLPPVATWGVSVIMALFTLLVAVYVLSKP